MATATTPKAAAPAAPAATDTATVAQSTVVTTDAQPGAQVEAPTSLEKSLKEIGISFGSNEPGKVADAPGETAKPEPGQEPSPDAEPAKENVDDKVEEPAAEADKDPDDTTLDDSSSQWPESALHEVSKLRAQKRELKSKAAEATTKLTELEGRLTEAESKLAEEAEPANRGTGEPAPSQSAALADVKTLPELRKRTAEAEELLEWCDDQLIALREDPMRVERELRANKVILKDREDQEDFSRDRMEAFVLSTRRKVNTTLQKHVPAREHFLAVRAESETKAANLFPWFKDKASPEYQLSQQILRAHPEIQQWPDWKVAVGIQVRGLMEMRKASAQAPGSKLQAPNPVIAPRVPGIPARAAARVDGRAEALSSASEKIRNPKNGEEVVSAISTLLAQTK